MSRAFPLWLMIAPALAGCTAGGNDYPSLLPRPIEERSDSLPSVPPTVVAPDATLDARLAVDKAKLASTAAAFETASARVATLADQAVKGGAGSEAWLDAQVALSELDGYRADSFAIASDLDQVAIERGAAGQPPYPGLAEVETAAAAQADDETKRIAALSARLPEANGAD